MTSTAFRHLAHLRNLLGRTTEDAVSNPEICHHVWWAPSASAHQFLIHHLMFTCYCFKMFTVARQITNHGLIKITHPFSSPINTTLMTGFLLSEVEKERQLFLVQVFSPFLVIIYCQSL